MSKICTDQLQKYVKKTKKKNQKQIIHVLIAFDLF